MPFILLDDTRTHSSQEGKVLGSLLLYFPPSQQAPSPAQSLSLPAALLKHFTWNTSSNKTTAATGRTFSLTNQHPKVVPSDKSWAAPGKRLCLEATRSKLTIALRNACSGAQAAPAVPLQKAGLIPGTLCTFGQTALQTALGYEEECGLDEGNSILAALCFKDSTLVLFSLPKHPELLFTISLRQAINSSTTSKLKTV